MSPKKFEHKIQNNRAKNTNFIYMHIFWPVAPWQTSFKAKLHSLGLYAQLSPIIF